MDTFRWNQNFLTGIAAVDEQHHHLVDLINTFSTLLADDVIANDSVVRILDELADYASYHFSEEEAMMRSVGIDSRHLTVHRHEHSLFIEDITSRRNSMNMSDRAQGASLLRFLIYWLIYHILGSDQNMARQVAAIRLGTDAGLAYEEEERNKSATTDTLLSALHGLFHLVSERNRELRELARTLEEKVQARTHELAEANRVLESMAMTDALTGLPNRRQVMKRLYLHWSDFLGNEKPISCLMIDADGFKDANDHHGHDAGDLVLTQLARALQSQVRTDDVVARLGGDEFLVILPKTGHRGAMQIAEKLRGAISTLEVAIGTGVWSGSISVGVATSHSHMTDARELLEAADRGVYLAKSDGRNCARSIDEA